MGGIAKLLTAWLLGRGFTHPSHRESVLLEFGFGRILENLSGFHRKSSLFPEF
jgi:hypothetical protein